MNNNTELKNDLNDSSFTVRMEAARKLGEIKSISAISPLIKALEAEDDLDVCRTIIVALEDICAHWTDPEDRGRAVRTRDPGWYWDLDSATGNVTDPEDRARAIRERGPDLRDTAQSQLQGLRDDVFCAGLVAAKYRAVLKIMAGEESLTDEEDVARLWGVRIAVGWLLNRLKGDDVSDDLARQIICSLFRLSDADRPNSIKMKFPLYLIKFCTEDIAGLTEVPGTETLHFILEVLDLSDPNRGDTSAEMKTVRELALAVLERFSHVEEVDLTDEDGALYDCRPDYIYLKTFSKARTLRCSWATDFDLRVLEHLPQLETLDLLQCEITDQGISCISLLRHLKGLLIYPSNIVRSRGHSPGCEISSIGWQQIGQLTQLEDLSLLSMGFDDSYLETLVHLKNLKSLVLNFSPITDAGVESLLKMKRLEYLDIEETDISEEAVARIKVAFPACKINSEYIPFEY